MDAEELANSFLRYGENKEEPDRWAWEAVHDLVRRDPERGWEITRILVNKANSDKALAGIAAGPLEDLLKDRGLSVIDRIEEESRKNARFHLALSGVWIDKSYPVFDRWYSLMQKYGYAEGKRRPL